MTRHNPSTLTQKAASNQTVKQTMSRQTSGSIPSVWKSYTPHSDEWFIQSMRRYGSSEQAKIKEVQQIAKKDQYFCFQCTTIYHLADYYVRNDKTQTFRYCTTCASYVEQAGTDIVIIQIIEEPEEEQTPEPVLQEEEIAYQQQISKQTTELPETVVISHKSRLANWHPLTYVGLVLSMIAFVWTIILFAPGIYNKIHYGDPPVTETDAVVGHHDSTLHPSHFIVTNNKGTILVIEMMGGDPAHMLGYVVGHTSDTSAPAFIQFDGNTTPNMYVYVGSVVFYMSNDGKEFKTH